MVIKKYKNMEEFLKEYPDGLGKCPECGAPSFSSSWDVRETTNYDTDRVRSFEPIPNSKRVGCEKHPPKSKQYNLDGTVE